MSKQTAQPHPGPTSSVFFQIVGKIFMKITGWKIDGGVPNVTHMVIIAAPHTTNWDFVYLIATAMSLRLKIRWMGKDTLFSPPFGSFMRALGGIAIDRGKASNLVDQLASKYQQEDKFAVVIPPSGTRKMTKFWKSGFYWIASGAKANIVCGFLDYERKTAGLGLTFIPSGDVVADMDRIRGFYKGIQGKYPERECLPLLKEEHEQEQDQS